MRRRGTHVLTRQALDHDDGGALLQAAAVGQHAAAG